MDVIVEAFLWIVDLVVPNKDSRYRRVQKLGCFLFGFIGLAAVALVALDVFVFGKR